MILAIYLLLENSHDVGACGARKDEEGGDDNVFRRLFRVSRIGRWMQKKRNWAQEIQLDLINIVLLCRIRRKACRSVG